MEAPGNLAPSLQWFEFALAVQVGLLRFSVSMARGRQHDRNESRCFLDRLVDEVTGAAAECLVAKVLGIFWNGSVETFKDVPDIGRVEVRSTIHAAGHLLVRPDDKGDRLHVLVTGKPEHQVIAGCMWGHDARREEWKSNRAGNGTAAYWIPQSALAPFPPRRQDF